MANPDWTEPEDWGKHTMLHVPQSGGSPRQAYGNGRGPERRAKAVTLAGPIRAIPDQSYAAWQQAKRMAHATENASRTFRQRQTTLPHIYRAPKGKTDAKCWSG